MDSLRYLSRGEQKLPSLGVPVTWTESTNYQHCLVKISQHRYFLPHYDVFIMLDIKFERPS